MNVLITFSHQKIFMMYLVQYVILLLNTKLMIPAQTTYPKSWTTECVEKLMTEHHTHAHNSVYECVCRNPEFISGSQSSILGSTFLFVYRVHVLVFPALL